MGAVGGGNWSRVLWMSKLDLGFRAFGVEYSVPLSKVLVSNAGKYTSSLCCTGRQRNTRLNCQIMQLTNYGKHSTVNHLNADSDAQDPGLMPRACQRFQTGGGPGTQNL